MSKRKTTIEINGRLYDATSGALLSPGSRPAPVRQAVVKPVASRPSKHAAIRRPKPKIAHPHAPKASQTLMRGAVKKPQAAAPRLKAVAVADLAQAPLAEVAISKSVHQLDPGRLHKAKCVPRSRLISHFSEPVARPNLPAYVPPAPAEALKVSPARPAAALKPPAHKTKTTADLLEAALQNATGHRPKTGAQTTPRKHRHAAAMTAAVLLVIGFAAVRELPAIRLHAASAKAGFSASLPSYRPAGYSLASLNAGPGVVASQYRSNSDQRAYSLTQKQSTWDNTDLRDNFVKSLDPHYQAADAGGREVFLYGDGNASWLNGGVWYIVQSHGSLSARQLLDLAASL